MFDNIIRNLEEWSQSQKLIKNAIESCKVSLNSCAIEEIELFPTHNTSVDTIRGYNLSDIKLVFDKQSLIFKHGVLSYPYIDTQIGLYVIDPTNFHFRGLKPIGTYRLIVTLDGKVDDDYLIIDEPLVELSS